MAGAEVIDILRAHIVPAALTLLPEALRDKAAIGPLIAIAWQESRGRHRRQIVLVDGEERPGPAAGFWQFEELGAVKGVLSHAATSVPARDLLAALGYRRDLTVRHVWERLEHNDVLAAGLARLLLWTLPQALPRADQPADGWLQYLQAWRPGKPHPETWGDAWRRGWATT
jgi:hypothetical protein